MTIVRFLVVAALLAVLITVAIHDAIAKGWFWKLSWEMEIELAKKFFPGTTHFFEVSRHGGFLAAIPLTPLLAWAFAVSGPRWNGQVGFIVSLASGVLAVMAMRAWAIADNDPDPAKHVLSGFAENGRFSVPGLCLTFIMASIYTIAAMYFLSPGPTDSWFPFIFAVALNAALVVGLIQPPLYVWNDIHNPALLQSGFFTVLVWILYWTHQHGYVLQ
jgi:hypothetical protein